PPERQQELEAVLSELAGVECRITPTGECQCPITPDGQSHARVQDEAHGEETEPSPDFDWFRLLGAMKEKLPGLYGWLAPESPEMDGNGRLCLKVNNPLAVEYLKRREDKLQAFFMEELGRTYRLAYEVLEEAGEPPAYDYEEEIRRQALKAAEAAARAS